MTCLCVLMNSIRYLPSRTYPCLGATTWSVQQVRWRKPRWVPVAKSKMFRVREPTPIDEEEMTELKERYNHYRTSMKTIRSFLRRWQDDIKTEDTSVEDQERAEREEHLRLMEINRKWNESVALQRETRQAEEAALKQERKLRERQKKEEEELQTMEEAIKYVKLETEQSKYFVTEETLDDEIEKMLNTRKDYNFSLDSEGNKIMSDKQKTKAEDMG